MRASIPVPGSAKARLIEAGLHRFERDGYDAVGVTDLAAKAGVTTGALYHHFGSKLGLYGAIRDDLEQRLIDRMHGAAGAGAFPVRAALLAAFDAAVHFGTCRILAEPPPEPRRDPITEFLRTQLDRPPAAPILAAAWRAALLEVADGTPAAAVRPALEPLLPGPPV
ncbi:TetR/AcrR family transcriptional regulator [Nonomuraea sp. NPDC050790]|uniref:TetR/AcrR family transcriptional regulator n=1 Tax=Nonomuraea sp. NPDC050790 TaxID=3364371 RepID=UPI0037AC0D31